MDVEDVCPSAGGDAIYRVAPGVASTNVQENPFYPTTHRYPCNFPAFEEAFLVVVDEEDVEINDEDCSDECENNIEFVSALRPRSFPAPPPSACVWHPHLPAANVSADMLSEENEELEQFWQLVNQVGFGMSRSPACKAARAVTERERPTGESMLSTMPPDACYQASPIVDSDSSLSTPARLKRRYCPDLDIATPVLSPFSSLPQLLATPAPATMNNGRHASPLPASAIAGVQSPLFMHSGRKLRVAANQSAPGLIPAPPLTSSAHAHGVGRHVTFEENDDTVDAKYKTRSRMSDMAEEFPLHYASHREPVHKTCSEDTIVTEVARNLSDELDNTLHRDGICGMSSRSKVDGTVPLSFSQASRSPYMRSTQLFAVTEARSAGIQNSDAAWDYARLITRGKMPPYPQNSPFTTAYASVATTPSAESLHSRRLELAAMHARHVASPGTLRY